MLLLQLYNLSAAFVYCLNTDQMDYQFFELMLRGDFLVQKSMNTCLRDSFIMPLIILYTLSIIALSVSLRTKEITEGCKTDVVV